MALYELCIDLGSSYTTIYKKNSGVVLREPTIALMERNAKLSRVTKIGFEAQKVIGKTAEDEVIVHSVVEGVIKNMEITKKIVTYFLGKVVPYKCIKPAIKIIVCLPVGLSDTEYEDYKTLFYSIGFAKIDFVYNLVSCSLINSDLFSASKANLLVNIGAGKTEIGAVINGKLLSACSVDIGGNLIDSAISDYLEKSKGYVVSTSSAKKLKQEIGSLYETDKSSMEIFVGDMSVNSQISTIISAGEIIKPIYECYFKIVQSIQAFFNECSSETAEDIKNDGILLYGGGAQITGLEYFFKKILNMSVFVLDNPEVCAVMGGEKLFGDYNLMRKVIEEN